MHSDKNPDIRNSDITENDAAHIRFREKHSEERVFCESCQQSFSCTSKMDIFQHYSEINRLHVNYYAKCSYCNGNVHRYRLGNVKYEFYHNCFRWKRGLDK